jgi:hypothetical protein
MLLTFNAKIVIKGEFLSGTTYGSVFVSVKILVPRRLANRCYLAEALLWVSISRFPLADVTRVPLDGGKWAEIDTRESPDHMALGTPLFLDTLTDHECMRAGLPPNPNNEESTWIEPERIRERFSWRGEDHARLEQELQASIAFHKRRVVWNGLRSGFLDFYKARLFVSLWTGELAGFGKPLPPEHLSQTEKLNDESNRKWLAEARTPIPASFWDSSQIDWERSFAEGNGVPHALIVVDTHNLLRIFPPSRKYPTNVMRVGDSYFLEESAEQQPHLVGDASNGRGMFPLGT